jgi:hypothetical protein
VILGPVQRSATPEYPEEALSKGIRKIDPAQKCVMEIADDPRAIVAEAQRITVQIPDTVVQPIETEL